MGTLFRAALGFAIAFYLVYPREAERWLQVHLPRAMEDSCPSAVAHRPISNTGQVYDCEGRARWVERLSDEEQKNLSPCSTSNPTCHCNRHNISKRASSVALTAAASGPSACPASQNQPR